ncbi:hypothetical protein TREMEDRAFT_65108 [Tremella mesenterica DSM 1558]|uniref:uncharacterized protein n=1 Tax=Tremella mesenterica (strain ATCC 24925 / CBS 8224 / DSM 1558 / NBRC 9311 / NRRL Y-6157 / RJB 2259-6 / UBC 559-6) TaxID=578456 RepID=UPI00032BC715|nr:uncharacterized protein TREMEDRAFT_65108 [Tremella mesenterica DSM 1558]EIW66715.1 hypothetical protein TREMEDRAFT_65108 [Tremella mesenterica DSM 1558]
MLLVSVVRVEVGGGERKVGDGERRVSDGGCQGCYDVVRDSLTRTIRYELHHLPNAKVPHSAELEEGYILLSSYGHSDVTLWNPWNPFESMGCELEFDWTKLAQARVKPSDGGQVSCLSDPVYKGIHNSLAGHFELLIDGQRPDGIIQDLQHTAAKLHTTLVMLQTRTQKLINNTVESQQAAGNLPSTAEGLEAMQGELQTTLNSAAQTIIPKTDLEALSDEISDLCERFLELDMMQTFQLLPLKAFDLEPSKVQMSEIYIIAIDRKMMKRVPDLFWNDRLSYAMYIILGLYMSLHGLCIDLKARFLGLDLMAVPEGMMGLLQPHETC